MLSRRRTPNTSVSPTATRNSQAANETASTMIVLNVPKKTPAWRTNGRRDRRDARIVRRPSAFGAPEARLDPIDRPNPVRRIDAFGRIHLDVGDDGFVLGLVPAGIDA